MFLLDFEEALMNHIILLFGVLLHSTVSIDSRVPPNRIWTNFFQLSLELRKRVIIEALKDVLAGKSSITFQDNLTDRSQSERNGWSWQGEMHLRLDHQKMHLPFVFLVQSWIKDDHLKWPRKIGKLGKRISRV